MYSTAQLIINNIEEDILASVMRNLQNKLNEIISEIEARTLSREELMDRVKELERKLRQTRQRF